MTRRRLRLVPRGCVEVFEVRAVLYLDQDGNQWVATDVADPEGPVDPALHELLGVLTQAQADLIRSRRDGVDIEEEEDP